MSIDLNNKLYTFGDARRELIPYQSGKPVCASTLWRWTSKGMVTPSGDRVKLRVVQVGGRPMLTLEAVEEFFSALTEARQESLVEREVAE